MNSSLWLSLHRLLHRASNFMTKEGPLFPLNLFTIHSESEGIFFPKIRKKISFHNWFYRLLSVDTSNIVS